MEMDTTIQREISFVQFVNLAAWFKPANNENFAYLVKGVNMPSRYVRWAQLVEYEPSKRNKGETVLVRVLIEPNAAFTICRTEFEALLRLLGFGENTPPEEDRRMTLDDLKGS